MRGLALGAAGVALWLGANPAFAVCQGINVLYQDSFDRLQPTWGEPSATLKVENGRLIATPGADQVYWVANAAGFYDDIDMCVSMTTVAGVDPEEAKAGVIFWYVDANNFYAFELAPNGKASVWRRQRGRWLRQVEWQDAKGANQGDGAINELRVTTIGGQASFYVNDEPFKELTGSPPDNGQEIGIYAASPEKGAATYAFDNLKVTKP